MTVSPVRAFADAAAAVVNQDDVTDILANLLSSCTELTASAGLGLLVRSGSGELELLSATSHQAAEIELYQLQHDLGPCLESVRTGHPVAGGSQTDMVERWGPVGQAIADAGYQSVYAVPLRWHGEVLGALNAFRRIPGPAAADDALLLQAYADVCTIVIVQSAGQSMQQLTRRVDAALGGRTVVEQAKGVLAYFNEVDMAAAYQLLRARAAAENLTLSEAAARIVATAASR